MTPTAEADVERGDVRWADLGEPRGSAPAKRRPILIVSADAYNRSRIRTVLCVVITSNLWLADAPGNVRIERGEGGLTTASVANVSQVVTLDKDEVVQRSGRISIATMRRVDAGLRRVLGLT